MQTIFGCSGTINVLLNYIIAPVNDNQNMLSLAM